MTRLNHSLPHKTAFSTLELMVTAAIIIVVVAIAVPVVGEIKRSAGKALCAGHLRQIGIGIRNYITEQNGKLPPEPRLALNGYMIDTLQGMLPVAGVNVDYTPTLAISGGPTVDWWICPSDPTRGGWQNKGARHGIPGNNEAAHGINAHSYCANMLLTYLRVSEIPRPSESIIVAEFPWGELGTRGIWPGGDPWIDALPRDWHQGHINCLFVDGHVESIEADTLALGRKNAYLWYSNYPTSGLTPKSSY